MLPVPFVLVAMLFTLSSGPQSPVAPAATHDAWIVPLSEGTNTCESWVDARRNEGMTVRATGTLLASRAWIWGLVSGASVYGTRPLSRVTAPDVDAWVDKYCFEHPLVGLDQAGKVLIEELAARVK
jgi:hypothetical protein